MENWIKSGASSYWVGLVIKVAEKFEGLAHCHENIYHLFDLIRWDKKDL